MVDSALPIIAGAASIAGGVAKRSAYRSQAAAADFEARQYDLRAKQVSADRRKELNDALASLAVSASQRNVSSNSPTAAAIRAKTVQDSKDAEGREVLGEKNAAFSKRYEAAGHRRAGTYALIGGLAGGISSLASSSLFKPGGSS